MISLLLAVIYLAFISLGLPDSLLGSAWPSIYPQLGVPISYAGYIFATISICTVISALLSDRLTRRFGTSYVTVVSVAMTAMALLGFASSHSYTSLLLWAVPYGLGAGSIDAALNNFVAIHYASRHMSWLHCMWGVGTTVGPFIMSRTLAAGGAWQNGYRTISMIQWGIAAVILISLPLWKAVQRKENAEKDGNAAQDAQNNASGRRLSFGEILRIPGVPQMLFTFFCYCALEQTTSLWASSYLVLTSGVSVQDAAGYASMFFIGITAGRAISGFITFKLNDDQMVRLGQVIILIGVALLLLPTPLVVSLAGLITIGLGCAPIYPSMIHATPAYFGADKSQAIIGLQMAFAYIGTTLMPPLFGVIASAVTPALFPVYLLILLVVMFLMHERLMRKAG